MKKWMVWPCVGGVFFMGGMVLGSVPSKGEEIVRISPWAPSFQNVLNCERYVKNIPHGCAVYLTIDDHVQQETEKALYEGVSRHRAERAVAIVMSVKTGGILAMASSPNCDSKTVYRCISENLELGSLMKTITACAVLNEGRHGPDSLVSTAWNDANYYRLPRDGGHPWEGYMSVRDALVQSSNIVFGKLGFDLGPQKLYDYMTQFRFGRKTGVDLPDEEIVNLPHWQTWDKIKWSRVPIGQGVPVTALQMAAAYAAIGNDGEQLRPYIVEKIVRNDGAVVYRHQKDVVGNPITPSTAHKVRDMLTGVVQKGGTARRATVPGYTVAGKTGTTALKDADKYSSNDYISSFVGIVPARKPEIVILVIYQKPLFCSARATSEVVGVPMFNHQGGVCAALTFSQIARNVLGHLRVKPDAPINVSIEK